MANFKAKCQAIRQRRIQTSPTVPNGKCQQYQHLRVTGVNPRRELQTLQENQFVQ